LNTKTRNALTRVGAGVGALALCAALTLGAASAASAQGIAPTAGPDFYAVTANTPLHVSAASGILSNDVDPEGDPISIWGLTIALKPGESLVTDADGSFVYTPPTDFTGTRVWSYRPADDTDQGPVVTITFTISGPIAPPVAVNAAPVANADAYAVVKDTWIHPLAPGVFGNDSDADGDAISFSSQGYDVYGGAGEGLTIYADGSFFYQPPAGFTGTRTWWYIVTDGTDVSAKAEITFTIAAAGPNTVPVAGDDFYAITEDVAFSAAAPGVLADDSDADGDAISVVGPSAPAGGSLPGESLSLDADGSFHYVPPTGFTGSRLWHYTATDGTDESAQAELEFTVYEAEEVVANPDAYAVQKDTVLTKPAAGFLENDTEVDGKALAYDQMWSPVGGLLPGESLALPTDDGAFSYTPPTGYVGDRVFTYTATNGSWNSLSTTLTFTITAVAPANTPPVANPDAYIVVTDVPFTRLGAGYVENDTDADGDPLMWSHLYSPSGGLLPGEDLTMTADAGAFVYTPPTGFTGTREWSYLTTDGTDESNYATITFTVGPQVALDFPDVPTLPDGDPTEDGTDDSTITTLASTGSTSAYALGTLAALLAATGFVLVRSSRREA
jgi:hypothetical protein